MNYTHPAKIIWTSVLLVLVIAALGGMAWFFFFYNNDVLVENSQPPTINSQDETADWKTYRNEEYGFEIKYPGYFNRNFNESKGALLALQGDRPEWLTVKVSEEFRYVNQAGAFSFSYDIYADQWKPEQEDVLAHLAPQRKLTATGLNYHEVVTGDGAVTTHKAIITNVKANIVIEIDVNYNNSYTECPTPCPADKPLSDEKTLNQILSTFKFTEPAGQTADWKTYKNDEYGFELRYPRGWGLWEANPILGSVVLYPETRLEEVIDKTISTTDRIDIGILSDQYIDEIGLQEVVINNRNWSVKRHDKPFDGGTENGIEYFGTIGDGKYINLSTGISNEKILLDILSTFKFTK